MTRVLVIGDVHGDVKKLEKMVALASDTDFILQVGDLGNFVMGSQSSDWACLKIANSLQNFYTIWGNHDRCVVDQTRHSFKGFVPPLASAYNLLSRKFIHFSYNVGDYIVTHAGIHPDVLKKISVISGDLQYLNYGILYTGPVNRYLRNNSDGDAVNAISYSRKGTSPYGGVLWRDASEPLADVKQIFGHTPHPEVTQYGSSWCIDTIRYGKLSGIWIPDLEVVEVS